MIRRNVTLVALGLAAVAAGSQPSAVHTFDTDTAGQPPKAFTFAAMRRPAPGSFLVGRNGPDGYLVHAAEPDARGYSMAIAPGTPLQDVVVSARIRLVGGALEAGLISRFHDERNYYVTLLDLGRGEMRMWRVFEGNHSRIEFKDDLQVDPSSWHTLKVVHRGSWVFAYLGGIRVFEDHDNRNRVFGAGRAGVMATADTEAWFDDLRIEPDRGHTSR